MVNGSQPEIDPGAVGEKERWVDKVEVSGVGVDGVAQITGEIAEIHDVMAEIKFLVFRPPDPDKVRPHLLNDDILWFCRGKLQDAGHKEFGDDLVSQGTGVLPTPTRHIYITGVPVFQ